MEGRRTAQEQGFHAGRERRRGKADRRAGTRLGRLARSVTGSAARLDVQKSALAVFAAIALLGVLGLIYSDRFGSRLNLDSEGAPPAWYSAGLLASAGVLALLRGRLRPRTREGLPWLLAGAFFLFMSLDEVFGVHEELEASTGIDWQLLYAPLVAVGAIAWLGVLRLLGPPRLALALFVAGAVAWLAGQALEAIQWSGNRFVHPETVVPEEVLEMTGSGLFALALLIHLRSYLVTRPRSMPRP